LKFKVMATIKKGKEIREVMVARLSGGILAGVKAQEVARARAESHPSGMHILKTRVCIY